jgi:hypothetical protein
MNLQMEPETSKPVVNQVDTDGHIEDEKSIHEGFMREALAMVYQPSANISSLTFTSSHDHVR